MRRIAWNGHSDLAVGFELLDDLLDILFFQLATKVRPNSAWFPPGSEATDQDYGAASSKFVIKRGISSGNSLASAPTLPSLRPSRLPASP